MPATSRSSLLTAPATRGRRDGARLPHRFVPRRGPSGTGQDGGGQLSFRVVCSRCRYLQSCRAARATNCPATCRSCRTSSSATPPPTPRRCGPGEWLGGWGGLWDGYGGTGGCCSAAAIPCVCAVPAAVPPLPIPCGDLHLPAGQAQ